MSADMWEDAVVACADLVGRTGASGFEIGHLREDVPAEEAGWYAVASFKSARFVADEHRSPSAAAIGLAERLLRGAACRCGNQVALSDSASGCRWRLMGKRWEPGCDAPPLHVDGDRGDYAAIHQAMQVNRAERRKAAKKEDGKR